MLVSNLLIQGERKWDLAKIHSLVPLHISQDIISTLLLATNGEKNGVCTVKSGYN